MNVNTDDVEPIGQAARDDQLLDDLDVVTSLAEMCQHASAVCTDAAHAASVCATTGWANEHLSPDGTSQSTQWCIASARVLGACADLLREGSPGAQVHLLVAQARAGLVAAQECAAACEPDQEADPVQAECVAACHRAAQALRGLITAMTPAVGDAARRASAT